MIERPRCLRMEATYGRGVFEFAKPAGPAIAVGLQDGSDDLGLHVGDCTLYVKSVHPRRTSPVDVVNGRAP